MKRIIIGDIHGDITAVQLALDNFPDHRPLFMGDFLDSFDNPVSRQIEVVNKVLQLVKDDKADSLLGNHELSYIDSRMRASGFKAATEVQVMPIRSDLFRLFHPCMYDENNRVLFSHAGLSKTLWDDHGFTYKNLPEKLEDWMSDLNSPLWGIGRSRGGWEKCGGLLWCDWQTEFVPIPGLRQVVGHSSSPLPPKSFSEVRHSQIRESDGNWNVDCLLRALEALEYDDETGEFIPVSLRYAKPVRET